MLCIMPCVMALGAKPYTPEITKVKFHRKVSVNVHWTFPVKSTGEVTILWKIPLTNEDPLQHATDKKKLENATDNPR